MIAQLRGCIVQQRPPELVIEVAGVGYEVYAPMTTFYQLPNQVDTVDKKVTLYTHLQIRDDAHVLFGFIHPKDRQLFRELIKISGVGPKLALTILSGMDVETFISVIRHQDTQSLVRLPGLGKKTAERLMIDMQDRVQKLVIHTAEGHEALSEGDAREGDARVVELHTAMAAGVVQEAEEALIALGYKPQQARLTIARLETQDKDSRALIKLALQSLA